MPNLSNYKPNEFGALSGVRIIDLSRLICGNVMTMVLGDLGAEVWKIESQSGDPLREWHHNGISTYWKQLSRNKKSISINLRSSDGIILILKLIETASIIVENFRPGTLEKMGLSPEIIFKHNPKIIIVRISGWGQVGPYSSRPGFGTLIEGMCGLAAANGFPDREPVLPPGPISDTMAGYAAASAALAAFHHANTSGIGQIIDQSLFMPLFISQGPQSTNFKINGAIRERNSNAVQYSVPRGIFKTSDDQYVSLSASMDPMPQRVFKAIGKDELNLDPKYSTAKGRFENKKEILNMVANFIEKMTQKEVVSFFENAEVTIAPIYDISQIIEDPHFVESNMVVDLLDEEIGRISVAGFSNKLSETPSNFYYPAPKIGEHTKEILKSIGIEDEKFFELLNANIVYD